MQKQRTNDRKAYSTTGRKNNINKSRTKERRQLQGKINEVENERTHRNSTERNKETNTAKAHTKGKDERMEEIYKKRKKIIT